MVQELSEYIYYLLHKLTPSSSSPQHIFYQNWLKKSINFKRNIYNIRLTKCDHYDRIDVLDNFEGDIKLYYFADIHCHTLFNIDDGAQSFDVMKDMLDTAYSDGIRTICFTPHFKMYEFSSFKKIALFNEKIMTHFDSAVSYVKEKYPDMLLCLGNEIMYHSDVFDSLENSYCRTLNGGSYVLVEFQPSTSSHELMNSVSRFLRKGYIPVIAHIERYDALIKNLDLVKELKSMGAVLQINFESILCFRFGKRARFIKSILKSRLVDVIASDAHNNSSFPQKLSKSHNYISKHYGEKFAEKLFSINPIAILNNEKIF
jgi:protein-tyrosine phosphatase